MHYNIYTYLEDYFVWLSNKGSSFEFSACNYLRFDNAFFLPDSCFIHVLFFQFTQLRHILLYKITLKTKYEHFILIRIVVLPTQIHI